ncbi:MAG: hypothetical protein IT342_10625 [Candidatus Melainabacteria bacterium]|nr:hypothetical protein [Candidatus Melainabacteria bacterium]
MLSSIVVSIITVLLSIGAIWLLSSLSRAASGRQRPNRAQRDAFDQCEKLLPQAYLAESCGNVDDAQWKFGQALSRARISEDALQLSESLNGLARARMKKGDGRSAIPLIEEALSLEPRWYTSKPNYSALMRRELEEARAIAATQAD